MLVMNCRCVAWSRNWVLTQLRGTMQQARAVAVAEGALHADALPRSCWHLKRVDQLPQFAEEWQLKWRSTAVIHSKTEQKR